MSGKLDTSACRTPRGRPGRIAAFYGRYSPSILHAVLTRLIDALIFTSAVIITACNFLAGHLDPPVVTTPSPPPSPPPTRPSVRSMSQSASMPDIRSQQSYHHHTQHPHPRGRQTRVKRTDPIMVSQPHVRQRTQDWLAQHSKSKIPPHTVASSSSSVDDEHAFKPPPPSPTPPAHARRDKRRTQSLSHNPTTAQFLVARHKEEARLTRLEERLHSLIEEGQAALAQKPSLPHTPSHYKSPRDT